jgi:hypothetical protein
MLARKMTLGVCCTKKKQDSMKQLLLLLDADFQILRFSEEQAR